MSRSGKRMLSTDFFSDMRMRSIPLPARFTYAEMITFADDHGHWEWDTDVLADHLPGVPVGLALDLLLVEQRAVRYVDHARGQTFAHLPRFARHQTLKHQGVSVFDRDKATRLPSATQEAREFYARAVGLPSGTWRTAHCSGCSAEGVIARVRCAFVGRDWSWTVLDGLHLTPAEDIAPGIVDEASPGVAVGLALLCDQCAGLPVNGSGKLIGRLATDPPQMWQLGLTEAPEQTLAPVGPRSSAGPAGALVTPVTALTTDGAPPADDLISGASAPADLGVVLPETPDLVSDVSDFPITPTSTANAGGAASTSGVPSTPGQHHPHIGPKRSEQNGTSRVTSRDVLFVETTTSAPSELASALRDAPLGSPPDEPSRSEDPATASGAPPADAGLATPAPSVDGIDDEQQQAPAMSRDELNAAAEAMCAQAAVALSAITGKTEANPARWMTEARGLLRAGFTTEQVLGLLHWAAGSPAWAGQVTTLTSLRTHAATLQAEMRAAADPDADTATVGHHELLSAWIGAWRSAHDGRQPPGDAIGRARACIQQLLAGSSGEQSPRTLRLAAQLAGAGGTPYLDRHLAAASDRAQILTATSPMPVIAAPRTPSGGAPAADAPKAPATGPGVVVTTGRRPARNPFAAKPVTTPGAPR